MRVDKDHPPTGGTYGKWERGLDPWHKDAFPKELVATAPNQTSTREEGWFEVDAWGNQVGFVTDGAEIL
jgi:hypothetical protein